mmetsp:Transcript_34643/g.89854  ORF Transcript_34643/g.89854 Transcript_34643/m.89854 type:complete len:99 (+) Transcript_34643:1236-1532(+)
MRGGKLLEVMDGEGELSKTEKDEVKEEGGRGHGGTKTGLEGRGLNRTFLLYLLLYRAQLRLSPRLQLEVLVKAWKAISLRHRLHALLIGVAQLVVEGR